MFLVVLDLNHLILIEHLQILGVTKYPHCQVETCMNLMVNDRMIPMTLNLMELMFSYLSFLQILFPTHYRLVV